MRPFAYHRAGDLAEATRLGQSPGQSTGQGQVDAPVQYLAGGTTLIDLMKLDVLRPSTVVDLSPVHAGHDAIEARADGLYLGAFAKMSAVADHPAVLRDYPAVAESLHLAASAQLRNMATLGGNMLQRTRCSYYRDPSWSACNKRSPGSGCSAIQGVNRTHAVLGVDDSCIAQYPGDLGVVLAALDAQIDLVGSGGARRIAFTDLHRFAEGRPHIETTLKPGEIITGLHIPAGGWTQHSLYLKVRDRASYEFALSSAAVALEMDGEIVRHVRIGLGGVAYKPWRAHTAEAALIGKPLTEANAEAAAEVALHGAVTHGGNDFKPELARRTLVRALMQAKTMRV